MPGLIDQSMSPPAAATPVAPMQGTPDPAQAPSSQHLTVQAVLAKMKLPPEKVAQLKRIEIAGKKVMYSKDTHGLMQQQLQGPGDMATKIGTGVAGLMGLLTQQSQGALPRDLLIPAVVILCIDAADFLKQAGQPITDADVGNAIQVAVHAILKTAGVDPDKVGQMGAQQMAQSGGAPAPDEADPSEPPEQPGEAPDAEDSGPQE